MGRKDAALLAAIAGFEALKQPTPQDLRQFSNLFNGLFSLTKEETRRTAAAALSRIATLPQDVSKIVAEQPIRISAPFLALGPGISDPVLLHTISRHGGAHARAISRRRSLSETVKTALASLKDGAVDRSLRLRHGGSSERVPALSPEKLARQRQDEDILRDRIKAMALVRMNRQTVMDRNVPVKGDHDPRHLVKYAEKGDLIGFSRLLADELGSDSHLVERILMDISGTQMAMALKSLQLPDCDIVRVLAGLFPAFGGSRAENMSAQAIVSSVRLEDSKKRVDAWVRANSAAAEGGRVRITPNNNNARSFQELRPSTDHDWAGKAMPERKTIRRA